jgi:hypothetical protein
MKIEPRRAPLEEAAAHQDDSTPEFEARAGHTVHRRTTVTVERETLSILIRRPVAEPMANPADQLAEGEIVSTETLSGTPDKSPPALRNELSGGKP